MKKVSICIPVYNGAKYVCETINSVLNQDYENLEILVSDDCSTDDTISIVESIKDNRIRIIKNKENLGLGGNWNVLLREATGDYLMIVCQDDLLIPGVISQKVKVLEENPDVVIVTSASYVINENSTRLFVRRPFKKTQKFDRNKIRERLFAGRNIFMEPPNNMLRRSAMLKTGEFDTTLWYVIDWDYWLRILEYGTAYYINKPLSSFRISKTSATGSNLNTMNAILQDEEVFLKKYKDGKIMPMSQDLLDIRKKGVFKRLKMKILFMKIISFMQIQK